jgi:hypothetical protein
VNALFAASQALSASAFFAASSFAALNCENAICPSMSCASPSFGLRFAAVSAADRATSSFWQYHAASASGTNASRASSGSAFVAFSRNCTASSSDIWIGPFETPDER